MAILFGILSCPSENQAAQVHLSVTIISYSKHDTTCQSSEHQSPLIIQTLMKSLKIVNII